MNIVIAGPGTLAGCAVSEACVTAADALNTGTKNGVNVDLNLHPYYPSSRGLSRFPDHPRCPLTTTARAATEIAEVVKSWAAPCNLYIGWNDEGHDRQPELRETEIERAGEPSKRFNETNDVNAIRDLVEHMPGD